MLDTLLNIYMYKHIQSFLTTCEVVTIIISILQMISQVRVSKTVEYLLTVSRKYSVYWLQTFFLHRIVWLVVGLGSVMASQQS